MKEYAFPELGVFSERDCQAIKEALEGKTFMRFHISWANLYGNCTLIVATDYKNPASEIKNFFLYCALNTLASLYRNTTKEGGVL